VFDNRNFNRETLVKERSVIVDKINDTLQKNSSGYQLASSTGVNNTYVDYMIFKGEQSISEIQKVVGSFNLKYKPVIRSN